MFNHAREAGIGLLVVLAAVACLALATPAIAQPAPPDSRTTATTSSQALNFGSPVNPAPFRDAFKDLWQGQQTAADRQVWAQSLAQAEARHRRSTWFLIGAGGAVGLALMYQARQSDTGYTYVSSVGTPMAPTLYLIGTGLGVYGFVERTKAQREIDDLRAEGRRRGFTVSLNPSGLRVSYALTF
jgi:hypothetical protein